jgi:hypothetical protein
LPGAHQVFAIDKWSGKSAMIRKKRREILVSLLFFLPFRYKVAVDHWLRGRKEYREVRKADFIIISPPKCGRTWVRVLLSRFLQVKYGLGTKNLLGFDNYHRLCPDIPKIRFTHDKYISDYTRDTKTKRAFYEKKVVFLVRDPRDVVVSNYFQWISTVNPFKRKKRSVPDDPTQVSAFDYAMDPELGLLKTICFLNEWESEIPKLKDYVLIRYEDLRSDSQRALVRMLTFMGQEYSDEQVDEAVSYASFENMKALESSPSLDTGSRRLAAKDPKNPDSFKVRRGKVGGYRDYLSAEQVARIDGLIEGELSPFYGYSGPRRLDGQQGHSIER